MIPANTYAMNIHQYFKGYQLTTDQKLLLDALVSFFESDVPLFLLKGYAGTGKTFILKGVASYLMAMGREVVMMAPTGRASQILTTKTGHPSTTIHRRLYAGETLRDTDEHAGNEYDAFKIFYGMGFNGGAGNAVYIADESSMVSNVYAENDIMKFGSGYLLSDLITYVFPDPAGSLRKIIFTGDSAQLPPVDMAFSPALDARYMWDKFRLRSMEFELSNVVRQEEHSKILVNATMLRRAIKENRFGTLKLEVAGEVVQVNRSEVVDSYLSKAGETREDAIVIAYSNRMVYEYNQSIRAVLYPGMSLTPVKGDRLVVVSNNYVYSKELLNGETGTLLSIEPGVETRRVMVKLPMKMPGGGKEREVVLRFRDAVIRFKDAGGAYDISCKIIDNLLFSDRRELAYHETVALFNDFKNRYGMRQNRDAGFRDILRGDPYFNALRVKFGYALTCHKAQGGEWKYVFVNAANSAGYNNESYFRWLYTAITRARHSLALIGIPGKAETTRLIEAGKAPDISASESPEVKPDALPAKAESLISELKKNLETKLKTALDKGGFVSGEIREISWGVQFNVSNKEGEALVRIFCSSRRPVASLDVSNIRNLDTGVLLPLFDFLNLSSEKMIIIGKTPGETTPAYGNHDESINILQRLKDEIEKIMIPLGITITKVVSNSYHEIYYFAKQSGIAVIKFHYNKKQQFTRFEVVENRSNGLEEVIKPLLNDLKI